MGVRVVGFAATVVATVLACGVASAQNDQERFANYPWQIFATDHNGHVYKIMAAEPSPGHPTWRQIGVLVDYAQPVTLSGVQARSTIDITEVNCATYETRILNLNYFTGPTGTGQRHKAPELTNPAWGPSTPGSISRQLAEHACAS